MVAKCTGIIPIIPHPFSASGVKIGAFYKQFYGFTDLRGKPAGRGRCSRGSPNQNIAGIHGDMGSVFGWEHGMCCSIYNAVVKCDGSP